MSDKIPPIGTLREKIELQSKNMSDDGLGGFIVSYSTIANVWASVNAANGREIEIADSRAAKISHIILMRYRSDLSAGDRIIYRNNILEIISINDLNGRKAYLKCYAAQIEVIG